MEGIPERRHPFEGPWSRLEDDIKFFLLKLLRREAWVGFAWLRIIDVNRTFVNAVMNIRFP
jgi:hypothetical protein